MGNTGVNGPPFPFAGRASKAPVRKSILVTDPMVEGGSGRKLKEPDAENFSEANVAVQDISYASVRGVRAERENGSECLVALRGTIPLETLLPSTVTETTRDCNGELRASRERPMGAALAIWEKVIGVSTRIAMSLGSPDFASSAK